MTPTGRKGEPIMENRLNIDKLMKTLSEILSEKYGCKVTITAIPKETNEDKEEPTRKAS